MPSSMGGPPSYPTALKEPVTTNRDTSGAQGSPADDSAFREHCREDFMLVRCAPSSVET